MELDHCVRRPENFFVRPRRGARREISTEHQRLLVLQVAQREAPRIVNEKHWRAQAIQPHSVFLFPTKACASVVVAVEHAALAAATLLDFVLDVRGADQVVALRLHRVVVTKGPAALCALFERSGHTSGHACSNASSRFFAHHRHCGMTPICAQTQKANSRQDLSEKLRCAHAPHRVPTGNTATHMIA